MLTITIKNYDDDGVADVDKDGNGNDKTAINIKSIKVRYCCFYP